MEMPTITSRTGSGPERTHDDHGLPLGWESMIRQHYPELKDSEIRIVMRALSPENDTFYTSGSAKRAYRDGILFAVEELHPRRGALISEAVWWGRKYLANDVIRSVGG